MILSIHFSQLSHSNWSHTLVPIQSVGETPFLWTGDDLNSECSRDSYPNYASSLHRRHAMNGPLLLCRQAKKLGAAYPHTDGVFLDLLIPTGVCLRVGLKESNLMSDATKYNIFWLNQPDPMWLSIQLRWLWLISNFLSRNDKIVSVRIFIRCWFCQHAG